MSIPKIQEIENSLEWKKINSTNITEGSSATFEEIKKAREVMIAHESNGILLVTVIPRALSGNWVKNQSRDIYASMNVNFATGTITNGGKTDTSTWIQTVACR